MREGSGQKRQGYRKVLGKNPKSITNLLAEKKSDVAYTPKEPDSSDQGRRPKEAVKKARRWWQKSDVRVTIGNQGGGIRKQAKAREVCYSPSWLSRKHLLSKNRTGGSPWGTRQKTVLFR